MAYGMDLMPVKVLDAQKIGTESTLVDGIYYAVSNGADVINMSLSFPAGYMPGLALEEAVVAAESAGVTMVAAVGNSGELSISYPAAFRNVLAVGAAIPWTDPWGTFDTAKYTVPPYSNHGAEIDFLAPGGELSQDANHDGYPDGILSQTFALNRPQDMDYWFFSGTSGAAAQVSALAGIVHAEGYSGVDAHWLLQGATCDDMLLSSGEFNNYYGQGMLEAAKIPPRMTENAPGAQPHVGVNTTLFLLDDAGENRAMVQLEVVEVSAQGEAQPLSDAKVKAVWSADAQGFAHCTTDRQGRCTLYSQSEEGAQIFGIQITGVVDSAGNLHRPYSFVRMEKLAYQLVASMGDGLGASGVAFTYYEAVLQQLDTQGQGEPIETVVARTTGVGLASSSIVLGWDYHAFLQSPMASHKILLHSYGTGLASSSLVWDLSFYNPSLLTDYVSQEAMVWNYPKGSGLASSSLWIGDSVYGFDGLELYHSFQNPSPAIVYFNAGTGLASSSIILNVNLWNPALFYRDVLPDASLLQGYGTGLASSSFIFDLDAFHVSWLGFEPSLLDWSMGGVGLASSSLVWNFDLTWQNTAILQAPLYVSPFLGMNESMVGLDIETVRLEEIDALDESCE